MLRIGILALILITALGEIAVAEPAIKPDWKNTDPVRINLSGITLSYTLPANLSADFPARRATNKNLYDSSLYQDQNGFVLAEYVWDYKTKTFWLQDILGSLQLRVSVYQTEAEIPPDPGALKNTVMRAITKTYAALGMGDRVSAANHETLDIGNVNWLRFQLSVGQSNPMSMNYAARLDDTHFVQFSFTIIESKPRDKNNWYHLAGTDTQGIMDSVRIARAQ